MSEDFRWWTAEMLVAEYGDQAYHQGIRLSVDAIERGEMMTVAALSVACLELMRIGYADYTPRKMPQRSERP